MYDPWLEHRLRLANRRGLLSGHHLSRVQSFALDLVVLLEAREQGIRDAEAFKMAIVSADPVHYLPLVYPESTTKKDEDITDEVLDDVETATEWVFEDAEITSEMAEQMARDTQDHFLTLADVDPDNDDW